MAYPTVTEIGAVNDIFAHSGNKSIPADGYVIAASITGVITRGLPLKQGATQRELTPVAATTDLVVAVAAATIDLAVTKAMPAYEQGEFDRVQIQKAITARAIEVTTDDLAIKARSQGIFFRDVVKPV